MRELTERLFELLGFGALMATFITAGALAALAALDLMLLTPGGWFGLGGWIGFGVGLAGWAWYLF